MANDGVDQARDAIGVVPVAIDMLPAAGVRDRIDTAEHPLQHPWIRNMRTLSPTLKREIRAFWFLYSDITADFMLPERADAPKAT